VDRYIRIAAKRDFYMSIFAFHEESTAESIAGMTNENNFRWPWCKETKMAYGENTNCFA